jgi:DNA polymerase III alpha subunit (gram-positive type)
MNVSQLSELLIVDVETSGPDPWENQILSASFVPLMIDRPALNLYVEHEDIQWGSVGRRYFKRYESEWYDKAISVKEAFSKIVDYLEKMPTKNITLVGHNVSFDYYFLLSLAKAAGGKKYPKISHRTVDTHTLLYVLSLMGKVPKKATGSLEAARALGVEIDTEQRHTAFEDAAVTKEMFIKILEKYGLIFGENTNSL